MPIKKATMNLASPTKDLSLESIQKMNGTRNRNSMYMSVFILSGKSKKMLFFEDCLGMRLTKSHLFVQQAVVQKVMTASRDQRLRRGIPTTPWPKVHPPESIDPKPINNPETMSTLSSLYLSNALESKGQKLIKCSWYNSLRNAALKTTPAKAVILMAKSGLYLNLRSWLMSVVLLRSLPKMMQNMQTAIETRIPPETANIISVRVMLQGGMDVIVFTGLIIKYQKLAIFFNCQAWHYQINQQMAILVINILFNSQIQIKKSRMLVTSHNPHPLRMSIAQSRANSKSDPARGSVTKEQFLTQFFDEQGNIRPEFRKISYEDGSEYIGQFQDCKHGKGMYSFPNNDVYMGSWRDDKFHGEGLYFYANGDKFQGKYQTGKKTGRGVYQYKSGAVYEGEWQKDRKNGFGIFYYVNGERYEGNWLNGEKHGKGSYFYANGDKYIGEWLKNKKNGNGVLQYENGAMYDGEWNDDKPSNKGEIIYSNKDKYEGTFLNGKKNGKGIYHYITGGKYKGQWQHDRKHGYGVIEYANGDKFEGHWRNGQRNGQGMYEYSNGDIYEGEWVSDLKEGQGKLEMATGDKYEGEWMQGKKNGSGLYIFANGDIYDGEFENGNRQGQGSYTWTDQSYYKGEWLADKMNGRGIYANSEVELEGYFENDNFVKPLH